MDATVHRMWLLALVLLPAALAVPSPAVLTEQGAVIGHQLESLHGRKFFAFQGIPYARPPIGKHRFKDPVPAKPWTGVWNATNFGSDCLQIGMHHVNLGITSPDGDEDCLFLNVYTPQLPRKKDASSLDVIVYIHGGAFMFGSSSMLGAEYLMDHDVVLVTINYRVGILGFLSTEDSVVPGNAGLKDQSLALRWVKNNIAAFGGNPDSVTVAGTSAGGASVHFHLLSPMSKGLIHRGMSWSGTALHSWAVTDGHRDRALKLADLMGCPTSSSKEAVTCLRQRPARALVRQTPHFLAWRFNPCVPFGPVVEVSGPNSFLDKHPAEIVLNGDYPDLPWMVAVTEDEGLFPAADFILNSVALEEFSTRFTDIIPTMLMLNYTVRPDQHASVAKKIQKAYFQNKPISSKTKQELIKLFGDFFFYWDAERAAKMQAASSKAPLYFYRFGHRGRDSLSNVLAHSDEDLGVCHGDDSGYIFNMQYLNFRTNQEDRDMIKLMTDICVNFAKTGNPTPSNSKFKWKPVAANSKNLDLLDIRGPSDYVMTSTSDLGNKQFWDSLPIDAPQIVLPKKHQSKQEL